ncbi:hypothetical protein [Streptomyces wuyuanensis]|uniref:hypothetical protein n=1 Tax=Streptomyces wuyuanensis TaxID=1196353 RepID=UPI003424C611
MGKELNGRGRVTIFPVLHNFEEKRYCVMSYTTLGDFGDTAVLGVIPIEGNIFEPGDLFALAGRHSPDRLGEWRGMPPENSRGAWLACLGFSARLCPKPGTIDQVTSWSLDMAQSTTFEKGALYGHDTVVAGRMTFDDSELEKAAREIVLSKVA